MKALHNNNMESIDIYGLYINMLEQPHLMIAGATGSGKSVAVSGLILTALTKTNAQFILIDPKRVELVQYRHLKRCIVYASEPDEMTKAITTALEITEGRYKRMQAQGVRKWQGDDVYIVIDEFADLMTTQGKQITPLIQRLAQIGRAASVHIILCTQCPTRDVIPTKIKVNFDARLGLRTRSRQDSINILGVKGCEDLPRYGQGFYMRPLACEKVNVPYYTDEDIEKVVKSQKKRLFKRKRR